MAPYVSKAAKKRLQEGIKKMNRSLTAAQRVRRKLLAGRPAPSVREYQPIRALFRLVKELEKAEELMQKARLEWEDIRAALVAVEISDLDHPRLHYRWLHGLSGKLAPYLATYEGNSSPVLFVGILWAQRDRAFKDREWSVWFSPFTRDPKDEEFVTAAHRAAEEEATKLNSVA